MGPGTDLPMSLDVRVTVTTRDGVELDWPPAFVEDVPLVGDNPKYCAQDLEAALDEANFVLGSKLKKLYGDFRED